MSGAVLFYPHELYLQRNSKAVTNMYPLIPGLE